MTLLTIKLFFNASFSYRSKSKKNMGFKSVCLVENAKQQFYYMWKTFWGIFRTECNDLKDYLCKQSKGKLQRKELKTDAVPTIWPNFLNRFSKTVPSPRSKLTSSSLCNKLDNDRELERSRKGEYDTSQSPENLVLLFGYDRNWKHWPYFKRKSKNIYVLFLMEIATVKGEATTRTGLQHTHTNNPSNQPLTWQHDNKSLMHREQVNGSTVRYVHPAEIIYYCLIINQSRKSCS